MDSFNQKVERINTAKEAIKTSLTNKGMNPSNNIEDYASLIDSIEQGSGSASIKVYASVEAMQNDKANMRQNDICEIHENYQYTCPISMLGEGEEVSFDNVIIPTQFIIGKFGVNALTLKYANQDETEYLIFKKAVLNTTKLTLTYKLANQDEVSHVYTYSESAGGYISDLSETLILNFNSTLNLVTDASLGSVKSRINTILNKEVLTFIYKFNEGEFEVLQGFNDTIATIVPSIENVHLGKDGDLALALVRANKSIKPDTLYNFITFKPEINKADIVAGDYSVDVEAQVDAPSIVPDMINRLSFIVTDTTITISLQISLMGITALSYADITYTLEGDKYKLTDPQVWEVRGDVSIGLIGDMKIEGFKIPNESWNDVYSLILNGAPEFKGIYEYSNITKSLHLAPNQLTAIAKDIKQGKNAYSLEGVIEGTATDLGTVEITATKGSQSLSGGFVDKIKVKAVDATIDENIKPENIKEDIEILGVKGTFGSEPTCHIFYSDEEAKAFTGYNLGDRAIVYGLNEEPFNLNFGDSFADIGINSALKGTPTLAPIRIGANSTVTLSEPITINDSVIWTSLHKDTECRIGLRIDANRCEITFKGDFMETMVATKVFKFTSTDGLTYTFSSLQDSLNTAGYNKTTAIRSADIATFREKVASRWDIFYLFSKFLCFHNSRILKNIYMYEPIPVAESYYTNLDNNIYVADLKKSIISPERTVIVPYGPINVQTVENIFVDVGHYGWIAFTDTDKVYIGNATDPGIMYNKDGKQYITLGMIADSALAENGYSIYEYDLKTKSKTTITPFGNYKTAADSTYTYPVYELENIRYIVPLNKSTTNDEIKYWISTVDIEFVDLDVTNKLFRVLHDRLYLFANIDLSLRKEYLGLHSSSTNLQSGYTAFSNDYIEGSLDIGEADAAEEIEINSVLDEIIGGAL